MPFLPSFKALVQCPFCRHGGEHSCRHWSTSLISSASAPSLPAVDRHRCHGANARRAKANARAACHQAFQALPYPLRKCSAPDTPPLCIPLQLTRAADRFWRWTGRLVPRIPSPRWMKLEIILQLINFVLIFCLFLPCCVFFHGSCDIVIALLWPPFCHLRNEGRRRAMTISREPWKNSRSRA